MGANRFLNAIQRKVGRQEDDNLSVFEFRPLSQRGVRLFSNNTVLPIVYEPGLSVKDVCEQAAREVGILPINLPFFTLVTVKGGHVVNLQKRLSEDECNQDYEFRLVFKGCHASWFADRGSLDLNALNYLFHQCRHDFLKKPPKLQFIMGEESNIFFVRLVLCEIIIQSREKQINPTSVLDNARRNKLLQRLLQRGLFAGRSFTEVKNYLKKNLHIFQKLEDIKLKRDYLHSVEQSDDYFVHKFHVNKIETNLVENRTQNVSYELLISSQFGIKKKNENEKHAEVIVENFNEISSLEIDVLDGNKLTINRTARTQVLFTQSREEAQSIVAIIDGYYKLLVNRYKVNLINQGRYFPAKVHGPILRQRAISKIQEYGTENGLFLIRQSRECYDQHTLSLYHNKKCEHYIILKENGEFYVKDTREHFTTLKALMEHYEKQKGGLVCCLVKNCPPSDVGFDALLDNRIDVPTSERPQDLNQFDLDPLDPGTIRELTEIGQGEYGKVNKAEWKKNEKENPIDVAIRKVKKASYNKEFYSVGKKLMKLKNPNIIRCHGIVRMKNEVGFVFEFAPKPLDAFLLDRIESNYGTLTMKNLTQYAAQIAEGMMYLQEMHFVHGRLCARNILVPQPNDGSTVKISDVGLSDLKKCGGQFFAVKENEDRHCWHPPELLVSPDSCPTHEGDIWMLGVTIWEIFTLTKPFHDAAGNPLSREKVLSILTTREQYLDTKRDSIPVCVANVIQKCWIRKPEKRMAFKDILLELRDLLLQQESQETLKRLVAQDKNHVESWEDQSITAESKPAELLPAIHSAGYSIMATDKSTDKKHFAGLSIPPNNGTSYSCGNLQFIPRKESIHRTSSDPGSPTNMYDEPLTEKFKNLLLRTVSFSDLQGTPPTQTNPDHHVEDTLDNFHFTSGIVDDGSDVHQEESMENMSHDVTSESEALLSEGGQIPTDESHSQSATHPLLTSVSSVEDKAMDFLRELNTQQKLEISTSVKTENSTSVKMTNSPSLPTNSSVDIPQGFSSSGYVRLDSSHTKQTAMNHKSNEDTSEEENHSNGAMGFLAGILQQKKKNTIDKPKHQGNFEQQTPQNTSSDEKATGLVQDNLHSFFEFHLSGETNVLDSDNGLPMNQLEETAETRTQEFHEIGDGVEQNFTPVTFKPESEILHQKPLGYVDVTSKAPIPPDNYDLTAELMLSDEKSHKKDSDDRSVLTSGSTVYVDQSSVVEQSPLLKCPFMDDNATTGPNSVCVDAGPVLQHTVENPFPYERSTDNNDKNRCKDTCMDEGFNIPEAVCPENDSQTVSSFPLPKFPFNEDSATIVDPSTIEQPTVPSKCPLMDNNADSGYIGDSVVQQPIVPKFPFTEDSATFGYIVSATEEQQILPPKCPLMEDNAGTVPNNGYIDHSLVAKQPILPKCPFTEDIATIGGLATEQQRAGPSTCPLIEDNAKTVPNTGYVDQSSAVQQPILSECPFDVTGADNDNKNTCITDDKLNEAVNHSEAVNNEPSYPLPPLGGWFCEIVQQDHEKELEPREGPITVKQGQKSGYQPHPQPDTDQQGQNMGYHPNPQQDTNQQGQNMGYQPHPQPDTDQQGQNLAYQPHPQPDIPMQDQNMGYQPHSQRDTDKQSHKMGYQPHPESGTAPPHPEPRTIKQDTDMGYQPHPQKNTVPPNSVPHTMEQGHHMECKPITGPDIDQQDQSLACDTLLDGAQHDLSMLMHPFENPPQSNASAEGIEMTTMPSCTGTSSRVQDDEVGCLPKIVKQLSLENKMTKRKTSVEELKAEVEAKFRIEKQNLKWKDRLGEGNFGVVYKGTLSELKSRSMVSKTKEVAIKELRKTADDKSQEDFIKEAINMSKLAKINNPNIIKFIGVCIDETEDEDKVMIVTELAPLGNLKHYLEKKHATIELSVRVDYCVQICNGMKELEKEDVLHRDLALRNILVVSEDLVKISDFGLARLSEYYKSEGGKWPLKWYAPESMEKNKFTSKSDVWSFGVTMWEIFSNGANPYPTIDTTKILEHIKEGNRLPKPDNCPDDIYDIMEQCWDEDAETRPSFFCLDFLLDRIKKRYCEEQ